MKVTQQDWGSDRKSDPGKMPLASELQAGTTMPITWIAQTLSMGSRGCLARLLYPSPNEESGCVWQCH